MPRSLAIVRALVVGTVIAAALAGCASSGTTTAAGTCGGTYKKVLLTDDSATTVSTFTATDVPKIFNIAATPAPTCFYKTVTTPPVSNGIQYTVTHRTLLYIGLSDADATALVAAVRKTASVSPWTVSFDNPAPAAPATPPPSATPSLTALSSSASWEYDFAGPATDTKGSMGYYAAVPLTTGTAQHAGLATAQNVVRVETELREVKK